MNQKKILIGGGLLAVILVAVAAWYVFLRDDAPDAVTTDAANEQLDEDLAGAVADPADDGADVDSADDSAVDSADVDSAVGDTPEIEGIDGSWVVDDEIGEFDFDTASGSFAGFRVAEELTIGEATAVGRSGGVTGTVVIADGILTEADVTIDMTTIVSNDSRRENAIRRAIDATTFPEATFTFRGGVDVSTVQVGGPAQSFTIDGDLTVAGVTQPVTFAIDANVRDDGFGVIVGSAEIVWEDFGVTAPSAPIVVSVADQGTVELQLIVTR